MNDSEPLFPGIDTGGTYTDAVLYGEAAGVVAKAKALTTRHDLSVGIAGAAGRVIRQAGIDAAAIRLTCMSTTLATNALVEGQGGRAALVMIGFEPADLARDGLQAALGTDPVLFCPGGHDVYGNARELDLAPLRAALDRGLAGEVSGFAIAGYFATRNPAHELAARHCIREACGLPVTCSHELTSRLGGPRRALTTLLNARLVPLITRLIDSTLAFMRANRIDAPLMVVRGDGALVDSGLARERPIETILSGPAASLVGARFLTGLDNAFVADIGGTTTDIAMLDGGRPRLDPEGATVGGYRTMVEAVAMRTFGLGGDSEVSLEEAGLQPSLRLGPRRCLPLSLAGELHGDLLHRALELELANPRPGRLDGRFAIRSGLAGSAPPDASALRFLARIGDGPVPLNGLILSSAHWAPLDQLVRRGIVQLIGFTPTDAAHVLGWQRSWDVQSARLGALLLARRLGTAKGAEEAATRVLDLLKRKSAEAIVETALVEDGLDGPVLVASPLVERALEKRPGTVRARIGLDRPLVGLGASAPLYYPGLRDVLEAECVVPPDADVANAIGAVVGQVRVAAEAIVSQPAEGVYRVSAGEEAVDHADEASALEDAEHRATALALSAAVAAGTDMATVDVEREIRAAEVEGRRMFVEARIRATASGRPRIAIVRDGTEGRGPLG